MCKKWKAFWASTRSFSAGRTIPILYVQWTGLAVLQLSDLMFSQKRICSVSVLSYHPYCPRKFRWVSAPEGHASLQQLKASSGLRTELISSAPRMGQQEGLEVRPERGGQLVTSRRGAGFPFSSQVKVHLYAHLCGSNSLVVSLTGTGPCPRALTVAIQLFLVLMIFSSVTLETSKAFFNTKLNFYILFFFFISADLTLNTRWSTQMPVMTAIDSKFCQGEMYWLHVTEGYLLLETPKSPF